MWVVTVDSIARVCQGGITSTEPLSAPINVQVFYIKVK